MLNTLLPFYAVMSLKICYTSAAMTTEEELFSIKDGPKNLGNCIGMLCDSVENYPEKLIAKILNENDGLVKEYFPKKDAPKVVTRGNVDSSNFTNMCNVNEMIRWPRSGKDLKNVTRFIINMKEYEQGIKMKYCGKSDDCECTKTLISGYEVRCIQEEVKTKLVVLDHKDGSNGKDGYYTFGFGEFMIQGGCHCAYKSNF